MIACPKCGGDTVVRDTRGNRRRRVCKDYACAGVQNTLEVPAEDVAHARRLFDAMEGGNE